MGKYTAEAHSAEVEAEAASGAEIDAASPADEPADVAPARVSADFGIEPLQESAERAAKRQSQKETLLAKEMAMPDDDGESSADSD